MKDCNSCGKCCLKYGNGGLSASAADIEGWELFNPEIYEYVLDDNIWVSPETGELLEFCPWLRQIPEQEQGKERYTCAIYHDRPEDCRHYPSTIAEMRRDECEMIELKDLDKPQQAQKALDKLMEDSRPPLST